jgi:hypothetical protein
MACTYCGKAPYPNAKKEAGSRRPVGTGTGFIKGDFFITLKYTAKALFIGCGYIF